MLKINAIKPKKPPLDGRKIAAECEADLADYSEQVVKNMRRYPAQKKGIKQKFKSVKQRRYFFWALRHGVISVPYTRTGNLREGWKARIIKAGDRIVARAENAVPYAAGVQGKQQWAQMRMRGWQRLDEVIAGEWQRTIPKLRIRFKGN